MVFQFLSAGSVLWLCGVVSWIFRVTGQNSVLVTVDRAGGEEGFMVHAGRTFRTHWWHLDDQLPVGLSLNRFTQIHLKPVSLCWNTDELLSQQQLRRDSATEQWPASVIWLCDAFWVCDAIRFLVDSLSSLSAGELKNILIK